ncbi:YceI family protein [Mycobacterium terramassiliense]|uniref:Polyisoprenoid-binding periplasmic protein YceI n=1 Tax=Mycobacterium terramassiliense TaxID=1841859 RepID=A0A2U3NGA9_9MYCO|nr:YceI family protein [Mycobacterium terramassiliense]SPM30549.1 Polyisoprenoid-binding periplasmic protein YceI [Mycobacterium terramassiliense]
MTTAASALEVGTWAIDPIHSSINFAVRHLVVSKVRGTFERFGGSLTIGSDGTPAVSAEIDVSSVHTGNEQRDAHLRSAEYFDVDSYPTATFTSTALRHEGQAYVLDGNFTLKGVTKPISLSVEFNGVSPGQGRGSVAGFEATVVLNRKDFGINVDLPIETGGVVVGDTVAITLNIEAIKQA